MAETMKHCITKHRTALDETICAILKDLRRIAVVGLSNSSSRDSNRVASYMVAQGYTIIPVNPEIKQALGFAAFPTVASAPKPVEVVNIFRRPEHIPAIVDQAIEAGSRAIWMQLGLADEPSAERARQAGLLVVMDRCIMIEHRLHFRH
jgi:predicted CoA-binding protein